MSFVTLTDETRSDVQRLAGQPWANLTDLDKDLVYSLVRGGLIGEGMLVDDVWYVGQSLLSQEA